MCPQKLELRPYSLLSFQLLLYGDDDDDHADNDDSDSGDDNEVGNEDNLVICRL